MLTAVKQKYRSLLERLEMNAVEWAGLDIGSSSVKLVKGTWRNRKFTVTGACQFDLPPAQNPQNPDDASVTEAVRRCLNTADLNTPYVVCAQSGPEVVTRSFRFPLIPQEALSKAVELEAQQMSPFDADQSIVAFQTVRSSAEGHQGFLVVAMRDAVERTIRRVHSAGGKVMLMDVEGLAAMNCLCHCIPQDASSCRTLIHLGHRFITVTILGDNGIPFIRDLTYAGFDIMDSIRRQTGLDEETIRQSLFGQMDSIPPQISAALKNAAARCLNDISDTLRYYVTQNPDCQVNKLYLSGGWAMSQPFTELMAGTLGVETEVFNPFRFLNLQSPPAQEALLKLAGPVFTVAAGLAMRTF
ncbi:MAG TPA: pilus assembly protein PilM [Anaerohalosphaeraceae bacterium]|nr:pilus assembly protein PilM [Anaerohalosphaeraceae bacterium]HOL88035.1 pilus assembly protein PilM [Anaerohalosphaeraceae bacterium]HPP55283.1 pilus assembly protein PilM [Anaerohalosphaeraceae bacterium]